MSPLPSFANHTVTVVEPGERLVHGSMRPDWSEDKVTTRTIERCLVDSRTSADSTDEPDTTVAAYKLLIPGHATPPSPEAKIRHPLAAGDYSIVGEVMGQPSIRGGVDHFYTTLERWKPRGS